MTHEFWILKDCWVDSWKTIKSKSIHKNCYSSWKTFKLDLWNFQIILLVQHRIPNRLFTNLSFEFHFYLHFFSYCWLWQVFFKNVLLLIMLNFKFTWGPRLPALLFLLNYSSWHLSNKFTCSQDLINLICWVYESS